MLTHLPLIRKLLHNLFKLINALNMLVLFIFDNLDGLLRQRRCFFGLNLVPLIARVTENVEVSIYLSHLYILDTL